ncbi:MAG: YiiX/YebB-like N1pC/P60 family cysteine hydrolase [Pseudomonadota bacterium]
MARYRPIAMLFSVLVPLSCNSPSLLIRRPDNTAIDYAVTSMWVDEIRASARSGDWLLSRSFFLVSDVISTFTAGDGYSHIAIYDADTATVIEAIGADVREVTLESFVSRTYHLLLVRPAGLSEDELRESVRRARSVLGVKFDQGGAFGFDDPDKLYCSELLAWAIGANERGLDMGIVIAPSAMAQLGRAIYYSGKRTDSLVHELAMSRLLLPVSTPRATKW